MSLTKFQMQALEVLKARLDISDPAHRSAREVVQAFDGPARLYIQTWVLPLIDAVLNGPDRQGADHWRESAVRNDYHIALQAREAAKRGTVAVTLMLPGWQQQEIIGRFATVRDAEHYIDIGARINREYREAGYYGIDAPEEAVIMPDHFSKERN